MDLDLFGQSGAAPGGGVIDDSLLLLLTEESVETTWTYWGGFTVFSTAQIQLPIPQPEPSPIRGRGEPLDPRTLLYYRYFQPVGNRVKLPMDWHW